MLPQTHDPGPGKHRQHWHQRVSVAGQHIEQRHGQGKRQQHRVQEHQPPPLAECPPHTQYRWHAQDSKMQDPRQPIQQWRLMGMRLQGFGVDQLVIIPSQQPLPTQQPQPGRGITADVAPGSSEPVARNLGRAQRAAQVLLGENLRVQAFEARIATIGPQSFVATGGPGVVADKKVRPICEVVGKNVPPTAKLRMATGISSTASPKTNAIGRRHIAPRSLAPIPAFHDNQTIHANTTGTSTAAFSRLSVKAPVSAPTMKNLARPGGDCARCRPQQGRHQKQIERGLLHDAVKENCRRIQGQQQASDPANRPRKEAFASPSQHHAR